MSNSDAERLARWRSWVDKDAMPETWDRNLWDEIFALLHRRDVWNGYIKVHNGSPEDAQYSARFLTQWILRNHIETQALAIRRIADRSTHPGTISLGRLLDEIAAYPHILGVDSANALSDAALLEDGAHRVRVFANKVVAHLDRKHSAASRDVSLSDLNVAVDLAATLWSRWYPAITGTGVMVELLPEGWPDVIRFHRRRASFQNLEYIGARILYELGEEAARELLDVLTRSEGDRAALIGRLYAHDDTREIAELLLDIESDPEDLVRLQVSEALRRVLGG